MSIGTTCQKQAATVSEEELVLDSAASSWAILKVAEELPAVTEVRQVIKAARDDLQQQLDILGLDEEELRAHLARQDPTPPFGDKTHSGLPPWCPAG